MDAALHDRPPRPPPDIRSLTLAVPAQHFLENLDAAVARCFQQALQRLRDAGSRIVVIEAPEAREIDEVFRSLVPADLLAFLGRERVEAQRDRLDPVAAERLMVAFSVRADDYVKMLARRRAVERLITERSRGIDAWVMPTVPVLPHPIDNYRSVADVAAWNRLATQNTRPGNLFGQCGISLPIHHLGSSMPVGLQLCASRDRDEALLALARSVEDLLGRPEAPAFGALTP